MTGRLYSSIRPQSLSTPVHDEGRELKDTGTVTTYRVGSERVRGPLVSFSRCPNGNGSDGGRPDLSSPVPVMTSFDSDLVTLGRPVPKDFYSGDSRVPGSTGSLRTGGQYVWFGTRPRVYGIKSENVPVPPSSKRTYLELRNPVYRSSGPIPIPHTPPLFLSSSLPLVWVDSLSPRGG